MIKKIVGILVCNSQKVLDHKRRDGLKDEGDFCYWEMRRFPNKIKELILDGGLKLKRASQSSIARSSLAFIYRENDEVFPDHVEVRLYFAVKGTVRGYFICRAMANDTPKVLRFWSEDWRSIPPVKIKPSQGFKYFNHEELTNFSTPLELIVSEISGLNYPQVKKAVKKFLNEKHGYIWNSQEWQIFKDALFKDI